MTYILDPRPQTTTTKPHLSNLNASVTQSVRMMGEIVTQSINSVTQSVRMMGELVTQSINSHFFFLQNQIL